MTSCRADMAFLDPPRGKLTGPSAFAVADGDTRHRPTGRRRATGSAATSSRDSVRFLSRTFDAAASVSREGAVHFVGMDWRCIAELMAAAEPIYGEAVDVAVCEMSEADPGFLYRSELAFIFVFGIRRLNVATGRPKRSRSNVWHYGDVKESGRGDGVRLLPGGKPVGFIADVLKDCTRNGDIVLDPFAGAGTTVMAAERVGRRMEGPMLLAELITAIHAEAGQEVHFGAGSVPLDLLDTPDGKTAEWKSRALRAYCWFLLLSIA
jgi:hypothetical protein